MECFTVMGMIFLIETRCIIFKSTNYVDKIITHYLPETTFREIGEIKQNRRQFQNIQSFILVTN